MMGVIAQQVQVIERELVLQSQWDLWIEVVIGLLVLAVLAMTVYNYRSLRPRWRALPLVGLRVIGLLLLIGIFYQPAWLEHDVTRERRNIAVLVDGSESQDVPHLDARTRRDWVDAFITRHEGLWERLATEDDLTFYSFGQTLEPLPSPLEAPDQFASRAVSADATKLVDSLEQLRTLHHSQTLGAVVILSDGIDTTRSEALSGLDAATRRVVDALDAPIHAVSLPKRDALIDVRIRDLHASSFAFLMNATTLHVDLEVAGVQSGQLLVRLSEGGQVISRERITVKPNTRDYRATLAYVPTTVGQFVYEVEVEAVSGELDTDNNRRAILVDVIRDKTRVLQVVGQPSWDQRFLREHLKQNPNVDLISFFILVGQSSNRPAAQDETALIPFPVRELFEEELGSFDLVIFQNFNYGPFQTRPYLPLIAEYVRQGGAFLMVGGPLSFSLGGYYGTPLNTILPVELPSSIAADALIDTRAFTAELTDVGRRHPITRLVNTELDNDLRWREMAEMEGVNRVAKLRPDALALLSHPSLRDEAGEPMPVVSVREVAQGRTMAVTTDTTWHWAFGPDKEGRESQVYGHFWSHAIRWLIQDPEMALISVDVLGQHTTDRSSTKARITVSRPDYTVAADHPVTIRVTRSLSGADAVVLQEEERLTDASGVIELEIPTPEAGIYALEARSKLGGKDAQASDRFIIEPTTMERQRLVGDDALLRALTDRTGGTYTTLDQDLESLTLKPATLARTTAQRQRDLWASPYVLVMLVIIFGLEWWLRRRLGFL